MLQKMWVEGSPIYSQADTYLFSCIVMSLKWVFYHYWLQPGFPSSSSRDNLCLLLPVTGSMTKLRPLSIKFFFEVFQIVMIVWIQPTWILTSCLYCREHITSLGFSVRVEACKLSGTILCQVFFLFSHIEVRTLSYLHFTQELPFNSLLWVFFFCSSV